ncbi:MAG: hypothetical protein EOP32_22040 [Rhodococcus sp. (in: high G+C Gram-positive bacteria)]|nr:MAG: hypothetical protein EOP32_22040 [Rhodococcus sp. (in: high G+C Gram-positive bacteria)]
MNTAELGVLEQVAVSELVAYSYRWDESGQRVKGNVRTPETDHQALGRLEELGLVARGAHARSGKRVMITSAGVEALAYIAATS